MRLRLAVILCFLLLPLFSFAQCSPSGVAGTVNICTPTAGATVSSPVTFQAAATPPSGQVITAMRLYVDNIALITVQSNTLNTSQSLANGGHGVTINAWTNTGSVIQAKESIIVGTGGVVVSITPTSASLQTGQTRQFDATVQGTTNTAVTWSVDGIVGGSTAAGTITTTGLYTAPSTAGNHTVTATSQADTTKSASASVSVTTASACTATAGSVAICTPAAGATVASPVTFTAAATAPSGQAISAMRLYIDSVAIITVNGGSLNTSQNVATGSHSIVVVAWTNTGASLRAQESITVGSGSTAVSVTISPTSATLAPSATQQFTATVQNTTNQAVTWSVDGVVGGSSTTGTVTTAGLYTAPSTSGTHTVTATSQADTTKSASASVTVSSASSCSATPGVVTICTPANGATVTSPVTFQAVAGAPSGSTISSMRLYIDSVAIITVNGASLFTSQTVATGAHNIVVNAWTNTGSVIQAKESITVSSSTTPSVTVTPNPAYVKLSATQQFTASVQNSTSGVNWSVDGIAGGDSTSGTIDATGLYTAPGQAGTHTVTATLQSDTTTSGSAAVYVGTSAAPAVYTYMYNNMRTGANTQESVLTPAVVTNGADFGKKGTWSLDASIQAQPLFVPQLSIGGAVHNVLYVATENDSVYALNADVPGSVLWKRNLIPSGASIGTGYTGGRTSIGGSVGITGTPVIDPNTNRLYVITRTTENSVNVQRIHALDLTTGADVVTPVVIAATVSGTGDGSSNGQLSFDNLTQNQRPGLLLSNGEVYVTFASFSDYDPYHGWVLAFNANTLNLDGVYNDTPNSGGGGIWMAGAAPAADNSGNVYAATANGRPDCCALFDPPTDMPNSVVKLALSGGNLSMVDYFSPYNTKCLSADDLDLGSSAPMLIPDQFNGMNLMALGSKEGRVYLLNRDNMGKYDANGDVQIPDWKLFNPLGACGSSTFDANAPWRVYGAPAYWNGNIYFGSAFGPLRQYNITTGKLNQVALGTFTYSASGQNGRGPLTVVSSSGTTGGIVWTSWDDLNGNGWLHAYDATDVSKLLYQSNYGAGTHFTIPVVVNGKVYVTGHNVVYMYGKLQ